MKISKQKAISLIANTNGQIFGVTFMKKDGTMRDMNCRLGVTKHLKGGKLGYSPADFDLMNVFDIQKKEYRSISLNTLTGVRVGGETFKIKGEK
jgi:hypothetical protein